MEINLLDLPFNKLIGIVPSDHPDYLVMLHNSNSYHNHIESVHAGALYTLAESTSALFMLNQFPDAGNYIPVLRRSKVKYKKQAIGKIYGKGHLTHRTSWKTRFRTWVKMKMKQ